MLDAIASTRRALTTAYELSLRAQTAVGGYRLAARSLLLLLTAMALDLFFPLDNVLRGLFMAGLILWTTWIGLDLRERARSEKVRLERAAILLESKHPEVENALINAVQFSAELAQHPDDTSAPLMRREIARAEREAARLPAQDAADLAAVARARKRLILFCAFASLSVLLFPRAYRFEVPRFLLFWADYPPFTLTDFFVTPKGARVKVGGKVTLTVRLGGLIPDSVTLVTATRRERERTTPLYAAENGVYTQTLDNLTTDTWYYVRANTGRSARYFIRVDQAPEVKTIHVTLRPPAYTQRPARTAKLDAEGIGGLYGTQVELDVEATRPLESGRLVLTSPDAPEEIVALAPIKEQPRRVGGAFTIRRGGRFRIDLTAEDGLSTRDAARGQVHLLRDEKPLVYVTVPGRNAIITPEMMVPLRVEAEDDVAVQRVELHRIVNNMADSAQTFAVPPGRRRADVTMRLDFKDLGARPGDVIQYYASAYDNDPGKPNLTDSERYWLWVVSEEDYRRILAQQRGLPQLVADYRALTDALKSLAEQQRALAQAMEKLIPPNPPLRKGGSREGSPNDPKLQQQMKTLQKAQRDRRQEARSLAQDMKRLAAQKPQYDMEKGLQKRLSELAKQIEQVANGAMQNAESASSPSTMAQQGERAAQQLARASGQGQRSVEKAMQALEKIAPLYQDVARLKRLAEEEAEIAMQARQLAQQVKRDTFAQSRLKELAERQAQARQELRQIQQDLDQHAEECESVASGAAEQARQLAQTLERMGAGEMMEGAENAFRQQDSPTGAAGAERARRALESLFQKCAQCQAGAKSGLDQQTKLCLGQDAWNTLEQLAQNMGQGLTPGRGNGGSVQGVGSQPAPQPGSRPGDGGTQGGLSQQAMALTLQQQSQGRSSRRENRRHLPGADLPGELGQEDIERLTDPTRKPSAVTDPAAGRYPAEYRRLVRDYFKAVAGGK